MEPQYYFSSPVEAGLAESRRDAILSAAANQLVSDGFSNIGLPDLLARLSIERLCGSGQVMRDELALCYCDPKTLLDDLFDAMLTHLEVRIAKVAAGDPESLGRFERAYRTVVSGRCNVVVRVCGLDGALVSRLFFLFMSVMDHESRNGTGLVLQRRWMSWYNRQIDRHDTPAPGARAATA